MTESMMPGGGGGAPEVINKAEQFKKAKYKSSISNLRNKIILLGMEYDEEKEFLASMRAYLSDLYNGPDAIVLNPEQLEVAINCMLLNKAKPETFGEAGEGYEKIREIATNRLDEPKIIRYQYGELAYGCDAGIPKPNRTAKENEDRVVVDTENNFFAVIDGVGGHDFGDVAAQYLAESLLQGEYSEAGIKQSFAQAVDKVAKYAPWLEHKEELMKTGKLSEEDIDSPDACVVACKLDGNEMTVFLAGDTRLLIVGKDGKVRFSTFDQGLSHTVASTFGHVVEGISHLRVEKVTLEDGDRVCLMSDGVTDNFSQVFSSNLGLEKEQLDALWEYLYVDGQWDLLEKKFPGFKANNQVMIEEALAAVKKIYDAGNDNLAELMKGKYTEELFFILSRHLNVKMNGGSSPFVPKDLSLGKPDNRSFLTFTYEAAKDNGPSLQAEGAASTASTASTENIVASDSGAGVGAEVPTGAGATSEQIKEVLAELEQPEEAVEGEPAPTGETEPSKPVAEKDLIIDKQLQAFENLKDKLIRQEGHYQFLKSKLEREILDLEEANHKINDFTAFELDAKRLDKEDAYLKTYGDYCRTYTLNIQRLRELDSQLKRAKFLYQDLHEKREIFERNLVGPLSPSRIETLKSFAQLWGEEIEGQFDSKTIAPALEQAHVAKQSVSKMETTENKEAAELPVQMPEARAENKHRLRVLFTEKSGKEQGESTGEAKSEVKYIDIHAEDGREFASISTFDDRARDEFANYETWQNSLLEKGKSPKEISNYDREIINKIFRLDFLAQKVDFTSLEDQNLARRLDAWYYQMHQKISSKYGILLPTIKNSIPLAFDTDGVAFVPKQYCEKLMLEGYKNWQPFFEKVSQSTSHPLEESDVLAFVEITLLGSVLKDATINIKQLTAIANRLNNLLGTHKVLKDATWLSLSNKEWAEREFPGLTIAKNRSFQRLELKELRKRSLALGENAQSGIFEFSLKYHDLDYHSETDEEIGVWKEYAKQEKLIQDFTRSFLEKLKKFLEKSGSFEEEYEKWENSLYIELVPLLSFAKVKNLKEVVTVLSKQADYVRSSKPKIAKFYDNIIEFYQNN